MTTRYRKRSFISLGSRVCAGGSYNNCDIEIPDALTPWFDVERFGAVWVGSIRPADALLFTEACTKKTAAT